MTRYSRRTGLAETYQAGPFDSRHFYVQWGGKLPGNETWSCGFRMLRTAGHVVTDGPALLVGIGTALAAFHAHADTQINPAAKLSFVKVNSIELDGTYTLDTTDEATYADIAGGGGAAPLYPNQTALACTATTGYSRGVAHKGRFYLPMPSIYVASTGLIADANRDIVVSSLATLRTAVNGVVSGYQMAVMSRKAGSPGHRAITGFEVGRVLDTQRRRRRSLVEDYTG